MTTEKIKDGTYFLHPEGSSWIGAKFKGGRQTGQIEESDAATHLAANDRHAGCVPRDTDTDITQWESELVVHIVMGGDTDPTMVAVQRARSNE